MATTRRTRSSTRASSHPAPTHKEEEKPYHDAEDTNLENLSELGIDETRGSIHPSEIDATDYNGEEEKHNNPNTIYKTYYQSTLDGWRDPEFSNLDHQAERKNQRLEREILTLRQQEIKRVAYIDRLRKSVERLEQQEQKEIAKKEAIRNLGNNRIKQEQEAYDLEMEQQRLEKKLADIRKSESSNKDLDEYTDIPDGRKKHHGDPDDDPTDSDSSDSSDSSSSKSSTHHNHRRKYRSEGNLFRFPTPTKFNGLTPRVRD
jgi:hypothetical protein